jgi:hypothetical protein
MKLIIIIIIIFISTPDTLVRWLTTYTVYYCREIFRMEAITPEVADAPPSCLNGDPSVLAHDSGASLASGWNLPPPPRFPSAVQQINIY